ncbi:MAG: hypothetical protein AAFX50_09145, partial [Acidobacteriota bacterium]
MPITPPTASAPALRGAGRRGPSFCLWDGDLVRIGLFLAGPRHPLFRDSGPIRGANVVFPRTPLRIAWRRGQGQGRERRRWSDPANLNFYNHGDTYERTAVGPAGDRCLWIEAGPALLAQLGDELPGGG